MNYGKYAFNILMTVLFGIVVMSAYGNEPGIPRLALIATGDERADTIAALVEARLSRNRDLDLLDRRMVGNLLDEQEWLSQGSLTTDEAIRAGVFLGCDVFAELRYQPLSPSTREYSAVASLIAFDAVTGSRLVDRTFSGVELPDRLAERATVALTDAVRAWREIGDGVGRTISVGTVRNVNLSVRHSHMPMALHALLERSLVNAGDGIALLDRQRLELVNQEARLSADRRDRLLASMVLIDIDMLQAHDPDHIRIRAVLKQWDGSELAIVDQPGPATSMHDRVQQLTVGILVAVDVEATAGFMTSSVQRRLESARYLADGKWHYDRGQWTDALRMAETALALWPESLEAQTFLLNSLKNIQLPDKSTASILAALDRHERILDIYEQWRRAGRLHRFSASWFGSRPRTYASRLIDQVESLETLPDDLSRRYHAYLQRARSAFMEPVPESAEARQNLLNMIPIWTRNSDAWLDDLLLVCGEDWLFRERVYGLVASQKRLSGEPGVPALRDPVDMDNLSDAGKRRLFDYYIGQADSGNMDACLAAVDFAHRFPDILSHAQQTMERYLDRAIDLAAPIGTSALLKIVSFIEESLLLQPGMLDVYAAALQGINQEIASRHVVVPDAYILLDQCDMNVAQVGVHLIQAVKLVGDNGLAVQSLPLPGRRTNLSRESRLRELRQIYRDRYGDPMPDEQAGAAGSGDSETGWGHMEILYQGYDAAPGLIAILRNDHVLQRRYSAGVLRPISAMEKYNGMAWILFSLGPSYELVRLHPETGETVSLGVVRTEGQLPTGKISFGKQTAYVPLGGEIACFATNGMPPWVLGLGDGLPDVIIDSVIEIDNVLYIGASRVHSGREGGWNIGDGMLLHYCMEQQTWQLLASSARTEGVSALDNTPPYRVSDFHHDAPGGRLLFGLHSMRHGQATELSGIWSMDLASRSLQRISPRLRQPHAPRRLSDGRWLVAADRNRFSFWLPGTDRFNHTSMATIYDSAERDKTMRPLIPYGGAHNITAILHNRVYSGWTCVIRDDMGSGATVLPTVPDSVLREETRFGSHVAPVSVRTYGDTVWHATRDAVWRLTPPPPPPNHDALPVTLCHSRAIAGNEITISTVLPKSDEVQWGLRHLSWRSERIPVAVAGAKEIRVAIPRDYIGLDNASDTLVVQAYLNDQLVAQGSVPIIIDSPYPVKSLQRAFSEAIYGIVETPRSGGLATLLTEAQSDLFAGQSVADLAASAWDVAIVDGDWLVQHGDSGRDALLAFLAKQNRRVLLTGVTNSNPFMPSWAISHYLNNLSSLKETNNIVAVDHDHGLLYENAADWLTVNDWNQAPTIVPLAGGDDRPMNLRPIYADTVSGAPFIVELFPSDGGRLLSIPFDLATALDTEIHAGYLLYRALQYLGHNDEPQWREVAYRENPATERWLRNVGVISPRSLAVGGMPVSTDQVMFLAAREWDDAVERWVRAGGTVIMLTNARGTVAPIENTDLYRGWIRGVSPVIIESYASMITGKTESWQSLLPSKYARRPVIPGVLDEVRIGAGRLLILAVPYTITPPARNLLSILLTNCEVRLGP